MLCIFRPKGRVHEKKSTTCVFALVLRKVRRQRRWSATPQIFGGSTERRWSLEHNALRGCLMADPRGSALILKKYGRAAALGFSFCTFLILKSRVYETQV